MTALTWASPQLNATLAAPQCDRMSRSWAGVGSSANRYANRVTRHPGRSQPQHVPHGWRHPAVRTGARTTTSGSGAHYGQGRHQSRRGPRPATYDRTPTAAAWTYSAPNLAKRSRCSTTIVVTSGSPSNINSFPLAPFRAGPTSVTTDPPQVVPARPG